MIWKYTKMEERGQTDINKETDQKKNLPIITTTTKKYDTEVHPN